MLEKIWDKIDKFFLAFAIALVVMSVMLVVAFRGIFSAYLTAYEIDQKDIQVNTRIDEDSLEEAYFWAINKSSLPLQVRD